MPVGVLQHVTIIDEEPWVVPRTGGMVPAKARSADEANIETGGIGRQRSDGRDAVPTRRPSVQS